MERDMLDEAMLDDAIIDMSIETGRAIQVKISGRSMLPLVGNGSVLCIRPYRRDIKKGDIILFRTKDRMIAHRVVRSCNGRFTTKGDASIFFDSPVQHNDIIGRAVFIKSNGKRTNLDNARWNLLNYMLACYSYTCGIIFAGTLKREGRSPAPCGAVNMLLPVLIYVLTKRL